MVHRCLMPLEMFFPWRTDLSQALPLVALQYHEVSVNIDFSCNPLPLRRLAMDNGLNTRLFNRRLSNFWAWVDGSGEGRLDGFGWDGRKIREEPFYKKRGRPDKRRKKIDAAENWHFLGLFCPQTNWTIRGLNRVFVDPARDLRKLADETVAFWMRKLKSQSLIQKRDHDLFIYLETATFFWELTEQEKIK